MSEDSSQFEAVKKITEDAGKCFEFFFSQNYFYLILKNTVKVKWAGFVGFTKKLLYFLHQMGDAFLF